MLWSPFPPIPHGNASKLLLIFYCATPHSVLREGDALIGVAHWAQRQAMHIWSSYWLAFWTWNGVEDQCYVVFFWINWNKLGPGFRITITVTFLAKKKNGENVIHIGFLPLLTINSYLNFNDSPWLIIIIEPKPV